MARYEPGNTASSSAPPGSVLRNHPVQFANVHARHAIARVQIAYSNPDLTSRFAELQIAGEIVTRVAFPPTGKTGASYVWIQAKFKPGNSGNILTFSTNCDPGPIIRSISVQ